MIITGIVNPVKAVKTEFIAKFGVFSGQFLQSYVKLTMYVAFMDENQEK